MSTTLKPSPSNSTPAIDIDGTSSAMPSNVSATPAASCASHSTPTL
jgi:hypothetical protein